jgi:hypothetical protein
MAEVMESLQEVGEGTRVGAGKNRGVAIATKETLP